MYKETIEIYSHVVMRHPARKFPGVLVQGDTLHSMKRRAEKVAEALNSSGDNDAIDAAEDIRDWLTALLDHYKSTLSDNDIPMPFHDPS